MGNKSGLGGRLTTITPIPPNAEAATTVEQLIDRWRAEERELARRDASVKGAVLVAEFLRDLASLVEREPTVTLAAAAVRTGYTADHLSRLVRDGALKNYGRKHAPRVRVSECPTKAALTKRSAYAYDADADARSLGARR